MLTLFLSFTLSFLFGSTQPSNFYSNYTSAREASKKSQKEMVVFFSSKSCTNCESAWSAFTKDATSTQKYISTRMEADDFDGAVCFAFFELKDVHAWVIMTPGAEIVDKWNGGWKDASGRPTLFDQSVPMSNAIEQKKTNPSTQPTTSNATVKTTSSSETETKKVTTTASATTNPTSKMEQPKTGYFIQAGYFGSEPNAQNLVADLKSKGYATFRVEPVQKDGSTFYRVISKVYNSENEVNAEQQKYSTAGIKTSVKKL